MRTLLCSAIPALCLFAPVTVLGALFDFDNAPPYASLPLDLTVDGITAHLSATGQGFSIQRADVLGFTPVGFAGNFICPNSVVVLDPGVRSLLWDGRDDAGKVVNSSVYLCSVRTATQDTATRMVLMRAR